MLIDTRTDESMISSFAAYLNISEDDFFQYINNPAIKDRIDYLLSNFDVLKDEIQSFFSDFHPNDYSQGTAPPIA